MVEVASLAATAATVLDSVAITATCLSDQVRRQFRQPLVLALGPAEFDRDVLALDEARFAQAFAEPRDAPGVRLGRARVQKADHRHRRAAARAQRAATRPRRRPAAS